MRARLSVMFLMASLCLIAVTRELKSDEKAPPSDKEIIDLVGTRMSKVFVKLGYPDDLLPTDVNADDPEVLLDYGSYGFKIQNRVVDCCIFFSNWKGTVYGAKIGDSQDDVVKKLGQPESTNKDSDGLPYLVWSFKDQDGYLMINFDKDNKMDRAVVNAE
ncbi:MAG TPA: hypothetical protein VMJ32_10650 [Pirellulales bacterium]|nr:hypothetical protein [Pirellulales bacterium]